MQLKQNHSQNIFGDHLNLSYLKPGKNFRILIACLFAATLYFPIFYWLERLPLSIFDEARIAVNAIEINWKKPWLTTYNGSPETWNLKPPLLPWLQRVLMYITGFNTLSVRLPSAFAALGCCMMFLFFSRKVFKNYFPGIAASLILVTSHGFIRDHVARNGDYDALLSFFILSTFLLFFIYIYTSRKKYLYLAAGALLGGLLTKGIAAVIFTPALVLFCIYERKLFQLLKQRTFWFLAFGVLAVMAGYYMLRDAAMPGYFSKVVEGEWMGIPMTVVQGHSGPWWYYIDYFFYSGFTNYALFLMAVLFTYMVLSKNTLYHKIAMYCLLFIVVEGGVLSIATSKLPWYDAPIYPVAALLTGVFFAHIFKLITDFVMKISGRIKPLAMFAILTVAIFTWPYIKIMQYIMNEPASGWSALLYEDYMRKIRKEKPHLKKFTISYASNNEQVIFFSKAYNKQYNYDINTKDAWQKFNTGDTIASCEKFTLDTLSAQFNYELLHQSGECVTFTLTGRK